MVKIRHNSCYNNNDEALLKMLLKQRRTCYVKGIGNYVNYGKSYDLHKMVKIRHNSCYNNNDEALLKMLLKQRRTCYVKGIGTPFDYA